MISEESYHPAKKISAIFRTLGQQARIEILLALAEGETCVCHLEALLGLRQAYISQHLMAMRKASIITSRRDGRFVFYSLADERLLDLIWATAEICGVDYKKVFPSKPKITSMLCSCPQCAPEADSERLLISVQ